MNKWVKLSLKILVGAIALIVALWLGIALYVNLNKKELLKQITEQLNGGINGKLTIESMKPDLVRGFPSVSVSLKNVLLRDSLYEEHHHDFLRAKDVYISINAFSILHHAPHITNIDISNGQLFMFTDSNGYSNTSIFRRKDNVDTTQRKVKPHINHIVFHNIDFTFQNDHKFKLFNLDIHEMEAVFVYNDTGWTAKTYLAAFVKNFAFNTEKGSYMKNKTLALHLAMSYDKPKQILSIPEQPISVGSERLSIGGRFYFSKQPVAFVLNIAAPNILFKNAKELMTPVVAAKLDIVNLIEPLSVRANINGHMKFRDTPLVHITWSVKNNTLFTPAGEVHNCSFAGLFMNQVDTTSGHTDDNSKISLYNLTGSYDDIPFSADTIRAINLIRPVIEGRFVSRFPLSKLNPVIGGNTFTFNKGNVDLNLLYKGSIIADDTTKSYIYGTAKVSNASMTYLPRQITFVNTSALVNFDGGDVYIENAKVQSGTSVLVMNGTMRNFLNLYYNDPAKIVLDWSIHSPRIDLNEFLSFLSTRRSKATGDMTGKPKTSGMTRLSKQLDNVLAACSVHMQLQVDNLYYKDFTADNIDADLQLAQSGIQLSNISINNAGGKVTAHGNIDQRGPVNRFHIAAVIDNVHVQEFFSSFQNFGQTAITAKNLQGKLFAKVDVTGSITDSGKLLPKSFDGKVDFDLRDGALINFAPFEKVGKYIFRNRNLSDVTFADLSNTLDVNGDKIIINPMLIESSAINLKVGGVYALSKGTDINIDVPLRNPKKDEPLIDDGQKTARDMKGITVHLKAVDGDDGNVKIKLVLGKKDGQDSTGQKNNLKNRLLKKIHK